MYYFAAVQQTSTVKLPEFLRFQAEERVLRVNNSKITGEDTFNGDYSGTEGNHGSSKEEKILFWVILQIYDRCFILRMGNTYIYGFRALFVF